MNFRSTIMFAVAFMAVATAGAGLSQMPVSADELCGAPLVGDLLVEQYTDAGDISVYNTADTLYVQLAAQDGWSLKGSGLHVATSLSRIPQRGGDFTAASFEHSRSYRSATSGDVFEIALDKYTPGTTLYLSAPATLSNGRDTLSGWSDGIEFNGRNWATYFTYTVQACD